VLGVWCKGGSIGVYEVVMRRLVCVYGKVCSQSLRLREWHGLNDSGWEDRPGMRVGDKTWERRDELTSNDVLNSGGA
jgi:hypothetical protein